MHQKPETQEKWSWVPNEFTWTPDQWDTILKLEDLNDFELQVLQAIRNMGTIDFSDDDIYLAIKDKLTEKRVHKAKFHIRSAIARINKKVSKERLSFSIADIRREKSPEGKTCFVYRLMDFTNLELPKTSL